MYSDTTFNTSTTADLRDLIGSNKTTTVKKDDSATETKASGKGPDITIITKDKASTSSLETSQHVTNATTLAEFERDDRKTIRQFVTAHDREAPRTISTFQDCLVFWTPSGEKLVAPVKELNRLFKKRAEQGNALLQAALVFDTASKSGLPNGAIRAILTAFQKAVAEGARPEEAATVAFQNISLAAEVENYVQHRNGLSTDIRHIAQFTDEANHGKYLRAAHPDADPKTFDGLIRQHQQDLDLALHAFSNEFGGARESGDYVSAYDALQRFFHKAAGIIDTTYWQNRPDTIAEELRPPERKSAPTDLKVDIEIKPQPLTMNRHTVAITTSDDPKTSKLRGVKAARRVLAGIQSERPVIPEGSTRQIVITPAIDLKKVRIAQAYTPDLERTVRVSDDGADPYGNLIESKIELHSWDDFPKFLKSLRSQQKAEAQLTGEVRRVILDLLVHGGHSGLLSINGEGKSSNHTELRSVAWINRELKKAGFSPSDITVVSEACNGGYVYHRSQDGFAPEQRIPESIDKANRAQKEQARHKSFFTLTKFSAEDVSAKGLKDKKAHPNQYDFLWVGRPTYVNLGNTVFQQYVTGTGISPGLLAKETDIRQPISASLCLYGQIAADHLPIIALNDMTRSHYSSDDVPGLAEIEVRHELAEDLQTVVTLLKPPLTDPNDAETSFEMTPSKLRTMGHDWSDHSRADRQHVISQSSSDEHSGPSSSD